MANQKKLGCDSRGEARVVLSPHTIFVKAVAGMKAPLKEKQKAYIRFCKKMREEGAEK